MVFHTTGSLPQMPLAPCLLQVGPSWAVLEWSRPSSCSPEEMLTYILEMQDENKVRTRTRALTRPRVDPRFVFCSDNQTVTDLVRFLGAGVSGGVFGTQAEPEGGGAEPKHSIQIQGESSAYV